MPGLCVVRVEGHDTDGFPLLSVFVAWVLKRLINIRISPEAVRPATAPSCQMPFSGDQRLPTGSPWF